MLQITSIKNGLVIDHIEAGTGIKIFNYLKLDKCSNQVALIINADSKKLGKKDIIKIENNIDIDYTILGLLSPSITINEVRNGERTNKITIDLPTEVVGTIKCCNPRCITKDELYVPQSFRLVNRDKGTYRCEYCDNIKKLSDL